MTKIKSITTTNCIYYIGKIVNELKIDYFKNESLEYPDNIYFYYCGYTKDNQLIVEIINSPTVIEYYEENTK